MRIYPVIKTSCNSCHAPRGIGDNLAAPFRNLGFGIRQTVRSINNGRMRTQRRNTDYITQFEEQIANHPMNREHSMSAEASSKLAPENSPTSASIVQEEFIIPVARPDLVTENSKVADQVEKDNPQLAKELRRVSDAKQELAEKVNHRWLLSHRFHGSYEITDA